jgi:aspartate/methionine/tyrosine aminotransferase
VPGRFAELDLTPNRIEQARRRVAAGSGYIDLTSSNPTQQGLLLPPQIMQDAMAEYLAARRYAPDPRGNPAAREALVAYYAGRRPPLSLDPARIFLTASTSEAYALLFALLADPGDNLLAPDVSYPLFDYLAAYHNLELRSYRLDEQRNWQIDGDSLRAAVDERSRAVLLVSPHNPTGAVQQAAIPELRAHGLPLICDEVFAAFGYAVPTVPPPAAFYPELPVFTLNGISKMFALPDLKLGWIALNEAAEPFVDRLELLNDTFLGANGLSQALLPRLFNEAWPFVETMVAQVRANLDLGLQTFAACPAMQIQPPGGGYYLFPALPAIHDEEQLVIDLLDAGVLAHPGFYYGEPAGAHLMLSALVEPERFAEGLERMCTAIAGL